MMSDHDRGPYPRSIKTGSSSAFSRPMNCDPVHSVFQQPFTELAGSASGTALRSEPRPPRNRITADAPSFARTVSPASRLISGAAGRHSLAPRVLTSTAPPSTTSKLLATHAETGPVDRSRSPSRATLMSGTPQSRRAHGSGSTRWRAHPDHRAPTFDNGNVPSISPFISGRWRPPARRAAWSTWSSTYS